MSKTQLSDKQAEKIYRQVVTDDTYWDEMTPTELYKRVEVFAECETDFYNLISLISCLRLTEITYLRRKETEGWSMPVIDSPHGPYIMIFSDKEQIKSESIQSYDTDTACLPDLLDSFTLDVNTGVIINPDTQMRILPLKTLLDFFRLFDDVVEITEAKMRNGVDAEGLDEVLFEHFYNRKVECELIDGTKVCGEAFMHNKKKKLGAFLLIDEGKDDSTLVYRTQVKYIKDVTETG